MLAENAPDNQFTPESFSDEYTFIVELSPLNDTAENIFNSFDVYIDELDLYEDECVDEFTKFSLETTATALRTALTASLIQGLLPVKDNFTFTELLKIARLNEADFKNSYLANSIELCTKIIISLVQYKFMWTQPSENPANESEHKKLITLSTPKIFTNSKLEACPNSQLFRFVKEAIVKNNEWIIDIENYKFSYQQSNNKGYKKVSLFTEPDKECSYYLDIIKSFDSLDIKYLEILSMEANANNNQIFTIDGKWLLELTGQDKEVTENKKVLSEKEKLDKLKKRLYTYSSTLLVSWYITELPNKVESGGDTPLFIIKGTKWFKYNNSLNLSIEIEPKGWAELTRVHFTYKDKDTYTVNTKLYPRVPLITSYLTDYLRINRKHFLANPNYRLKLTFKELLSYVANKDLKLALANSAKANWLKNKLFDDFKYIENNFGWKFYADKNIKGITIKEFCNRTFEFDLPEEHRNKILNITYNKVKTVKKPIKTKKVRSAIDLSQLSGDKVKAIRKELKMTQAQFGSSLGYDRSTVSKIENGNDSEEFINALIKKYKDIVQKYL